MLGQTAKKFGPQRGSQFSGDKIPQIAARHTPNNFSNNVAASVAVVSAAAAGSMRRRRGSNASKNLKRGRLVATQRRVSAGQTHLAAPIKRSLNRMRQ